VLFFSLRGFLRFIDETFHFFELSLQILIPSWNLWSLSFRKLSFRWSSPFFHPNILIIFSLLTILFKRLFWSHRTYFIRKILLKFLCKINIFYFVLILIRLGIVFIILTECWILFFLLFLTLYLMVATNVNKFTLWWFYHSIIICILFWIILNLFFKNILIMFSHENNWIKIIIFLFQFFFSFIPWKLPFFILIIWSRSILQVSVKIIFVSVLII